MSPKTLSCFINQLIRTNERAVLKQFTDAIQNDLWEVIRKRLPAMIKNKRLPKPVKELVASLLRNEFSSTHIKGDVSLAYFTKHLSLRDKQSGARSTEKHYLNQAVVEGVLKINLPFKKWRWRTILTLSGTQGHNLLSQESGDNDTALRQVKDTTALHAKSSMTLVKRNSHFKATIDTDIEHHWRPLADQLKLSANVAGSLALRNPWKSGFSLEGSAKWFQNNYADPFNPIFNTQKKKGASATTEASYLFSKHGIVSTYQFNDSDEVLPYYHAVAKLHAGALLAHIGFKSGYFRLGAGGGSWSGSLRLLGEQLSTSAKGGETHGVLEIQLMPKKWFALRISAQAKANYDSGDYAGWFPSWTGEGKVYFAFPKVTWSLAGQVDGHQRKYDVIQTKHSGSASTTLSIRPSNSWNIGLYALYFRAKQTGHQPYTEQTWMLEPSVGVRLLKKPDIWLQLGASIVGYTYTQDDFKRDQNNYSGTLVVTGRF